MPNESQNLFVCILIYFLQILAVTALPTNDKAVKKHITTRYNYFQKP